MVTMDAEFWHDLWEKQDIGFHQADFNPLMVKHFAALRLDRGAHIFVPLCGKTRDIAWLLSQGYRVTGAELSETAVQDLYAELGVVPEVTQDGPLTRYAADGLVVFVGDVFDVTADRLGAVDAVYDRAALVALPEEMRQRYVAHVIAATETAPQVVIVFTYDQTAMEGPPFSINAIMIDNYFEDTYAIKMRESVDIPGPGLKGQVPARESVWLLTTKVSE